MAIYSESVPDLAQRVASKKKRPSAAAAREPTPQPPVLAETAQERRNRLARERRARQRQEKLDAENGVTLATGKIQPVIKDRQHPIHMSPTQKDVIPATTPSASSTVRGAAPTTVAPDPPTSDGGSIPSSSPSRSSRGRKTTPSPVPAPVSPPAAGGDLPNGHHHTHPSSSSPPPLADDVGPSKPTKRAKVWPSIDNPDEPPKWYTSLLTDVIKAKLDQTGEKTSKRVLKETSEEVAKEKWADPAERQKQDKLFHQIFRRMA